MKFRIKLTDGSKEWWENYDQEINDAKNGHLVSCELRKVCPGCSSTLLLEVGIEVEALGIILDKDNNIVMFKEKGEK